MRGIVTGKWKWRVRKLDSKGEGRVKREGKKRRIVREKK